MRYEGENREIYFTTPDFSEEKGIDRVSMNNVYNVADVYASSSTGSAAYRRLARELIARGGSK